MNSIKNSVRLIGNLGMDPEIIKTEKGTTIAKVSMATSSYYFDTNKEKITDTQWHRLVFFGKVAELAEKLLKKGNELAIEGKLTNRSYEKDGETKYITEIVVNEFNLFSREAVA